MDVRVIPQGPKTFVRNSSPNGRIKKSILLGVPYGTACNRLRKSLLFELSKKLGMDICYRCSEKIVSVEDFSIDHKNSWALSDDPIKSFFNIENVSFSHNKCNYGAWAKY